MEAATNMSDNDAEQFVRELFMHVLRLDSFSDQQVTAWKQRLLDTKDPINIFRSLIELPVHKQQMAGMHDSRTRWPPGHFYSPIISRREVTADRERITAKRELPGIDLREDHQLSLLGELVPFMNSIPFSDEKTSPYRYYYSNPSYGFGDAVVYWAILQRFRPQRIIEIGSGFSSALALDTVDLLGLPTICTFIDPYPAVAEAATAPLNPPHRILPARVQDVQFDQFDELAAGDLLFIDSSHVLKTGSDVHFELTELLPRLRPGVLIHFHDTFNNFEYPERWTIEQNHSWNELYAIHLFLMYNKSFQIEYFNHHLAKTHPEKFKEALSIDSSRILLNPGGGLWIRRV